MTQWVPVLGLRPKLYSIPTPEEIYRIHIKMKTLIEENIDWLAKFILLLTLQLFELRTAYQILICMVSCIQ